MKRPITVAKLSQLADRKPKLVTVADVDVLLVRLDDEVCALHGRCPHRGASLERAKIEGRSLVCAEHGWDFLIESGSSEHVQGELLTRFSVRVDDGGVVLDEDEIRSWQADSPAMFQGDWLLGL